MGGGGSEGVSVALAINRAGWEQSDGANGRGPAEKRPLYGGKVVRVRKPLTRRPLGYLLSQVGLLGERTWLFAGVSPREGMVGFLFFSS